MSTVLSRGAARQVWTAVRALAVLTVLTLTYTLAITVVGQLALPAPANGSRARSDGRTIGSALIGQSFTTAKGAPLPQWFQSRPSAAGYDGGASGASNLGPNDAGLTRTIEQRRRAIAERLRVPAADVPPDAVTASASGLDPHISPAYARLQAASVARTRHLDPAVVERLVARFVRAPDLGYLGSATVNVLALNAALAKMDPSGDG